MINVSSIAKPSTFVRKMVGIYGQVAKILTVCPRRNVLIRTKWTDTHFCPEKGRFYGHFANFSPGVVISVSACALNLVFNDVPILVFGDVRLLVFTAKIAKYCH